MKSELQDFRLTNRRLDDSMAKDIIYCLYLFSAMDLPGEPSAVEEDLFLFLLVICVPELIAVGVVQLPATQASRVVQAYWVQPAGVARLAYRRP